MTTEGIIFVATISIVTFIIVFLLFARSRRLELDRRELKALDYIVGVIIGIFSAFLALLISIVLILCSARPTDENYHTIYSNKINAKVKFSSKEDVDFVGGQPIKQTSNRFSGTLTLSKDGSTVDRTIYTVEYLGDVEKGSVVEKIEYSNSVLENNLFGITIFRVTDWNSLKIHLKTSEADALKEKRDAQNRKELNSLLDKD